MKKRTTVEEFDNQGRLIKRTMTEKEDGQYLMPIYPAPVIYTYPVISAVPPPQPWPTWDIICGTVVGATPTPMLTTSTINIEN